MALTSPKMSLNIWNQLTDPYDHAQLADNWAKVDFHDHTPGRGVQIPTEGLADGSVTAVKLAASVDPTSVYSTYKMEARGRGFLPASATNSLYFIPLLAVDPSFPMVTSGATVLGSSVFPFDPADYAVPSRTTVLRIKGWVATNATAPGTNFQFGLYPISSISGLSAQYSSVTTGTVVGGSTATITTPGTNQFAATTPTDFVAPAAGYYTVGVTPAAGVSSTSRLIVGFDLQVRQI